MSADAIIVALDAAADAYQAKLDASASLDVQVAALVANLNLA